MDASSYFESLRAGLREGVSSVLSEVPQEYVDASREWIATMSRSLERLERLVDDVDDARYAVAMRYIAMKATWIEHNTTINYEMVKQGEPDAAVVSFAGTISGVLGAIEPFVDRGAVDRITTLLADPMRA